MLTHHKANDAFGSRKFSLTRALTFGGAAALLLASSTFVYAQNSPLTVQPANSRVGINKTNPGYTLDVAGPINATGGFFDNGSPLGGGGSSPWTTSGNNIYYNNPSGGYVGIGNTNPLRRLFVQDGTAEFSFGDSGGSPLVQMVDLDNGGYPMIQWISNAGANPAGYMLTWYGGGGFNVNGPVFGTAKYFQIDHPMDKENKQLLHASLEGPEVAVYYRGEEQLIGGVTTVTLPTYFESLTLKEQRTVQLTPVGGWSALYLADPIAEGQFTVRSASGDANLRFYWEVKAVRADVPQLVVEKLQDPKVKAA